MERWREISEILGGWKISTEGNLKREGHDKVFYVQGRPQRKYIPEIRYTPADYINGCLTMEVNGKPMFYNIGELVAKHCVSNPNRYKYFQYIDGNPSNVKASNIIWTKTPDEPITQVEKVEQVIQEKGENNMGVREWFGFGKKKNEIENTPVKDWNESLETSAEDVLAEISEEAVEKVKEETIDVEPKKVRASKKATKTTKKVKAEKISKKTSKVVKASKKTQKIFCETTGEYFNSVTEACKKLGLNRNSVYPAMSTNTTVKGYKFTKVDSEISTPETVTAEITFKPVETVDTDEVWYPVKDFDGFEVSTQRRMRRQGKRTWNYLKQTETKAGKITVCTTIDGKYRRFIVDDVLEESMKTQKRAKTVLPVKITNLPKITATTISVKKTVTEELQYIIDNFKFFNDIQLLDHLNIALTMSKETDANISDARSDIQKILDRLGSSVTDTDTVETVDSMETSEVSEITETPETVSEVTETDEKESWRTYRFKRNLQFSRKGNVRKVERDEKGNLVYSEKKLMKTKSGYKFSYQNEQGKQIVKPVAFGVLVAFHPKKKPGKKICYKDGNSFNASLTNISWSK